MKRSVVLLMLVGTLTLLFTLGASAQTPGAGPATLRGGLDIPVDAEPPRMPPVENRDLKRPRNYPMQPPTIPHKIDNYQVDLNVNTCMSCHSRRRVEDTQAPMVSVTHYMDRNGQFLAEVSPRRYFCNQCHVTQAEIEPAVANTFEDVDSIIQRQANQQQ